MSNRPRDSWKGIATEETLSELLDALGGTGGATDISAADGAITTLGAKADPVATVANATQTEMSVLKGILDKELNPVSRAVTIVDGGDIALGAKADSAATDSTSSWSAIALFKGIFAWCKSVITSFGELKVYNPPATMMAIYRSPTDFAATFLSSTSLTITGAPFTVDRSICRVTSIMYETSANATIGLFNGRGGVSITCAAGVVTVIGAGTPFTNTDLIYDVNIIGPAKAYDPSTDTNKVTIQNPPSLNYVPNTLIPLGTANTTAGTYNYPSDAGMSMDGYSDFSLSYKFTDADATITMTVEATNDPAATTGSFKSVWGIDTNTGTKANSWSVTNGTLQGSVDFDNLNYTWLRVKVIFSGSSNTAEIFTRQK